MTRGLLITLGAVAGLLAADAGWGRADAALGAARALDDAVEWLSFWR